MRRWAARARGAAAAPLRAFATTVESPALARVQAAWSLLIVATWVYTVVLAVYAYRASGAAGVAVAVIVRTLPPALVGPALGALGDRFPRSAVMTVSAVVTTGALTLTTVGAAVDAPELAIYVAGAVVTGAGMAFRAALSATLPALAGSVRDLTAANIVTTTVESAAVFAGPGLAAVLLAFAGPELGFAAAAGLAALASMTVAGLHAGAATTHTRRSARRPRGVAVDPIVRLILALLLVQTFVSGALTVYYTVAAFELLDMGASGVGLLTASFGVGGLVGCTAAFVLAGTMRLVALMTTGLFLWGAPLALIAAVPEPPAAVALLIAVGVGNVLFDITTVTLLQRTVRDEILARVFGALETVVALGLGFGAAAAPVLVDQLGVRGALAATGALLPAAALLAMRALVHANRDARVARAELAVLGRVPIFAGLPAPVLENLAFHARHRAVAAGERLMTQGDPGDAYYAIASGRLRVIIDGEEVAQLEPGDGAGEIALLRDVPRVATVEAIESSELLAIERGPFLSAVTGHAQTRDDANALVAARMAAAGPPRQPG